MRFSSVLVNIIITLRRCCRAKLDPLVYFNMLLIVIDSSFRNLFLLCIMYSLKFLVLKVKLLKKTNLFKMLQNISEFFRAKESERFF